MVFNELRETVTGILGSNEEEQNLEFDQDFTEKYEDDVFSALENQDYDQINGLVDSAETGRIIEDYIHHKITTASNNSDYFQESVDDARELALEAVNQIADLKIAELDKQSIVESDKAKIRNTLNYIGEYVDQLNSNETAQAIRKTFKSFHQASLAAEYVENNENIEMNTYDPQTVKKDAVKKASELREMDENMGIGFMKKDYEKLSKSYEDL